MKAREVVEMLENLCPKQYALGWDNPGMHVGHWDNQVKKVLIAVDADDTVVDYAVNNDVDMIIAHHPLIFSGIKQINDDNFIARRVMKLIENGINCYCMHTNFDVAGGMATEAADRMELLDAVPLEETVPGEGIGRVGNLPEPATVGDICRRVKEKFGLANVILYGDENAVVSRVGISPGSGKSMIEYATMLSAQVLITGDISYHDGIDSVAKGVHIIDAGHYGIEHIFIDIVKKYLIGKGTELEVVPMPINNPQKFI